MKKKVFGFALAIILCAALAVSVFAVSALAAETRTVQLEDGRSITLTIDDLIAEEIIMVRGDNGVTEETCFYIPFSVEVAFSGDIEGEGCWNDNLIYKNGAYEPNGRVWRNWDILADGSPGLIFYFDRDYGGDLDYYEQSDLVDCYHGFYFKYSIDFRPAWHGKVSPWAIDEVGAAMDAGLVPESLLAKDYYMGSITRSETAQVIINLIEKAAKLSIDDFMKAAGVSVNNDVFDDTDEKAVLAANALGIINGVGNNRYDPAGILTRAQFAAIINRAAKVMGAGTAGFSHTFTDVAGHWVDAELGWPVHAGIIGGVGDNRFDPDSKLTTEQTIAMTYRSYNALNGTAPSPGAPSAVNPPPASDAADALKYDTIIDLYRDMVRYDGEDASETADSVSRNLAYELGILDDEQKRYGLESSIFEVCQFGDRKIGYALLDINKDGGHELFILSEDYDIQAVYTLRDGVPALVGAYWSRNRCSVDKDGIFYINGSSGAEDSFSASYTLDAASGELKLVKELDSPFGAHMDDPTRDAGLVYIGIQGRAD